MRIFFTLAVLILVTYSSKAQFKIGTESQTNQLRKNRQLYRPMIIPATLLLAGAYSSVFYESDFLGNEEVKEERNEKYKRFHTNADDYLQYAPIITVYGLNVAGVKGKNNFGNRTALLIKSELLMAAITFSLKKVTAVPRPDTREPTSFPSGHTAQAFAAATFLHEEYGGQSLWYSIGGYSLATSIGILRVMNNRHWVSDVFAGAAIGILSTKFVYMTHQFRWSKKSSKVLIYPSYSGKVASVYLSYKL